MTYEPPDPVCRRPGCDTTASARGGFCTEHGLIYLRWRAQRDLTERADLHGLERAPGDPLADDPALASALDLLHRLMTRGPFERPLRIRRDGR